MNCPQAQHAIQLDLDGELTPARKRILHRHLDSCAACREIMGQHAAIRAATGRLAAMSPALGESAGSPDLVRQRWLRRQPLVAAAAAIALCIGGWRAVSDLRQERTVVTEKQLSSAPSYTQESGQDARSPAPDLRSLVHVEFNPSSDVIVVPKPTRNPNITVLWIYPAVRTAEAKAPPPIEPGPMDSQGVHS